MRSEWEVIRLREIKFRMWDKRDNKMRYEIDSIGFDIDDYLPFSVRIPSGSRNSRLVNKTRIEDDGTRTQHGNEEAELMQYTGLKDKNGCEIYEDDIVAYTKISYTDCNRTEIEDIKEPIIGSIYYAEGVWLGFKYANGTGRLFLPGQVSSEENNLEIEIIGNVFENPEMLAGDAK